MHEGKSVNKFCVNYLVKVHGNSVKYSFMILIHKYTQLDDLLWIYKCVYNSIYRIPLHYGRYVLENVSVL